MPRGANPSLGSRILHIPVVVSLTPNLKYILMSHFLSATQGDLGHHWGHSLLLESALGMAGHGKVSDSALVSVPDQARLGLTNPLPASVAYSMQEPVAGLALPAEI